jgi:FAD-dependent oxidoreductase family protein
MLIPLAGLMSMLAVCNASPTRQYDVIVVGAGTSGVMAAIQAARRPNTSVALLEETAIIGGQLGAAGVTTMDGGWNPPLALSGLHAEFRVRVGAFYAGHPLSQACSSEVGYQGCSEPHVSRDIFIQMLDQFIPQGQNNGSSLCLFPNVTVTAVTKSGNTVTGLTTGPGTPVTWTSHVVIDATEYGDVIPLAGATFRIGKRLSTANPDPDNCVDDITFTAVTRQYGPPGGPVPTGLFMPTTSIHDPALHAQFHSLVASNIFSGECEDPKPMDWRTHQFYRGMPDSSPNPPVPSPLPTTRQPTKSGVNFANDYHGYHRYCPDLPNEPTYEWRDRLSEDFILDPDFRQDVICEAKKRTLEYLHYMQSPAELNSLGPWAIAVEEYDSPYGTCDLSVIPAALHPFERLMPPIPYVRESRRIVAVDLLTGPEIEQQDSEAVYRRPVRQPQALALGDYSIDLHNCRAITDFEPEDFYSGTGSGPRPMGLPGPFQIPFGTFIPATVDGFLPAEKNLGYTRMAAGATRLQPSTMLVGQAAGAIAALAAERNEQPRLVRVLDVQKELLKWDAALAIETFVDVGTGHARWADTQLVSTYGLMRNFVPAASPFGGTPFPGTIFTFGVNDAIQRSHAAFAVVGAFKLIAVQPLLPRYGDVPLAHPDYYHVEVLAQRNFDMSGCTTGNFCPSGSISRRHFARWLAKAWFGVVPPPPPPSPVFADVPVEDADYATIQAVGSQELMFPSSACGAGGGNFCPNANLTRGDTARSIAQSLYKLTAFWH